MTSQSSLSTKNVRVQVMPDPVNGQVPNPTGDPVTLAFMPISRITGTSANPGSGDWHPGSWYTPYAGVYQAQCLVGPDNGGVPLAAGDYLVWVRIVDNPEIPTEPAGTLTISP